MNTYKVLVLKNDRLNTKDAFYKAVTYFSSRNPSIKVAYFIKEVTELTSVHKYIEHQGFNTKTGQPDTISYLGLDDIVKDNCRKYVKEGEYDCVIFSWDMDTLNHPLLGNEIVTSFSNEKPLYPTTEFIQLAINQYCVDQGRVWDRITHENMHAFVKTLFRKGIAVADEMDLTTDGKPFYKNDDPSALDGNYARTLKNLTPYISKLYKTTQYIYFSQAEVDKWKLTEELWVMLDKMRETANTPFVITSGYRTPNENTEAGGKANSSHLRGLAVDLAFKDNFQRSKMLKGIMAFADNIFLEEALAHFHIDIDYKIHELGQALLELKDN